MVMEVPSIDFTIRSALHNNHRTKPGDFAGDSRPGNGFYHSIDIFIGLRRLFRQARHGAGADMNTFRFELLAQRLSAHLALCLVAAHHPACTMT